MLEPVDQTKWNEDRRRPTRMCLALQTHFKHFPQQWENSESVWLRRGWRSAAVLPASLVTAAAAGFHRPVKETASLFWHYHVMTPWERHLSLGEKHLGHLVHFPKTVSNNKFHMLFLIQLWWTWSFFVCVCVGAGGGGGSGFWGVGSHQCLQLRRDQALSDATGTRRQQQTAWVCF